MEFIKQCKGIDANKIKINEYDLFYSSKKYDGIYLQIQKVGNEVCFFTSSAMKFNCLFADSFLGIKEDFKIECEYFVRDGLLGSRAYADNEIKKVIKDNSFLLSGKLAIFDFIDFDLSFKDRIEKLNIFKELKNIFVVDFEIISFFEAKNRLKDCINSQEEGLFLKRENHFYIENKKSNDAIKLKNKFTADLKVIEIKKGYITLEDEQKRIVKNLPVGMMWEEINLNDIIEIEYEQILDTYQIPVFKCIRDDKVA